jgi:heme exporter protein CcmD
MNAWPFVIGAYGICLITTLGLVTWSWLSLRRAEEQVDSLSRRP